MFKLVLIYYYFSLEESKSVRPARKKLELLNLRFSVRLLYFHKMDKYIIVAICIVINSKAQAAICDG